MAAKVDYVMTRAWVYYGHLVRGIAAAQMLLYNLLLLQHPSGPGEKPCPYSNPWQRLRCARVCYEFNIKSLDKG